MGIDVDPLPLGLFQEFLQHDEVVAGDEDGLARLRAQLHGGRDRVAEARHVGRVKHSHHLQINLAALHGQLHIILQLQGRIGGSGQGLVEEGIDIVLVPAEDPAVVGISGHPFKSVGKYLDG